MLMYYLRVVFTDTGLERIRGFKTIPECLDAYNICVDDPNICECQIFKDLTCLFDEVK